MTEFEKNPNPTKDQHFMVDRKMIEHICSKANMCEGERIVEIGGGAGALTEILAKSGNPLTVIELDHYYAELLKEKFKNFSNVTVIEGNALEQTYLEFDRVIANLPYTITEPLLVGMAQTGALYKNNKDKKSSCIKSITLVVSQNSVRKMVAPIQVTEEKSRHFNAEFGLISAICQTYLDVEIDCAIPSSAFFPEPAVTSFLVNLTPKKKKTTVDRIMSEILMDRMNRHASVERVYQLMLSQGKIYNIKKHKSTLQQNTGKFTSKSISDSNVYDLTNAQISQLIKDLIKNDSKMKSKRSNSHNNRKSEDSYEYYMRTGRFDYCDEDAYDDEEEQQAVTKWQKKTEDTYAYLYDETRYNALLQRGLEFIKHEELMRRLAIG